jgi:hypothetical protein
MTDGLYRSVRWSHVTELPVMGVPVTFETNAAELLEAVEQAFGSWRGLHGPEGLIAPVGAHIGLVLTDGPPREAAPRFRSHAPDAERLVVAADGSFGIADVARRESVGYVERSLLPHRLEVMDGLIEPLTLFQVGGLDRQPLHASAVVKDGVAILLEGPSGTGKSTLAYAAGRLGFTPLADDAVYVQTRPRLRVWGRRFGLSLRAEARAHFPELKEQAPVTVAPGKTRVLIPPTPGAVRYADRAVLCLLRRGGRAALERIQAERVIDELTKRIEEGFDLYAETLRERVGMVAREGAWSLTLGDDPAEAARLLDEVAIQLARP